MSILQEQSGAADLAGPLAEVAFWRSRTEDLDGIRDQLDDRRKSTEASCSFVTLLQCTCVCALSVNCFVAYIVPLCACHNWLCLVRP